MPIETVIFKIIGLRGGVAPVRRYIPELLDDVLTGRINPGRVFDFEVSLDNAAEGYNAMNERRATNSHNGTPGIPSVQGMRPHTTPQSVVVGPTTTNVGGARVPAGASGAEVTVAPGC